MSDKNKSSPSSPLQRIMNAVQSLEKGEYDPESLTDLQADNSDMAQLIETLDSMARSISMRDNQLRLLRRVIPVGVSLSAEKDFNRLLETVVIEAQTVTNADAGTLYLLDNDVMKFVIVRNTSLGIQMGGTSGNEITFQPVKLYKPDGTENRANVASYVAWTRQQIRLADAYEAEGLDFSGTKKFDANTGYRSKSFLAKPLVNAEGKVIGVLQLINAQDPKNREVVPFEDDDVLEALVLLAAAALDGYIREESLRREIAQLKIEIDQVRRAKQVSEITDSAYFKDLQSQVTRMRERKPPKEGPKE